MDYESMPRAELIAELQSWDSKFKKEVAANTKRKREELDSRLIYLQKEIDKAGEAANYARKIINDEMDLEEAKGKIDSFNYYIQNYKARCPSLGVPFVWRSSTKQRLLSDARKMMEKLKQEFEIK